MISDIIIIGSGPAGLTAGIYCARAGKSVKLFAGNVLGGQLTTTSIVENYPGFEDGIPGGDLMGNMMAQALAHGVDIEYESVENLTTHGGLFVANTETDSHYAKAVIIASGKSTRWLGIDGEKELIGKGISACAVCDGSFYKDKKVAVVGGGDSACEEAIYLSNIAKEVYVLVRGERMRAQMALQKRVFERPNIHVLFTAHIHSFKKNENGNLCAVNVSFGGELPVDGLFVAIGKEPNLSFLGKGFGGYLCEDGHIYTKKNGETKMPGLFAAGDVTNSNFNQAIIAAGSGAVAAISAIKFVS